MPAVSVIGDNCTGHGCYSARPLLEGSGDVFVNGKAVSSLGDALATHCCPGKGCHDGVMSEGSGSVFINGKAIARIGDGVSCGSVLAEGSGNVFAGG